jgi:hypothetical protein
VKKLSLLSLGLGALLVVTSARADSSSCVTITSGAISCIGTLASPEDFFTKSFTVSGGPTSVTIQTYGFGGGINANSDVIAPGGFDSLVALFSGTAATASILTDSSANAIASVSGSTQFFPGCPPTGTVNIGGSPDCGDNRLTTTLLNGTYTLLLSDANFIPFAVNPGPPSSSLLSDGFADLTGGVFHTCDTNGTCIADNSNFAVDILGLPAASVPEPATVFLVGSGILVIGWRQRRALRPAHPSRSDASSPK